MPQCIFVVSGPIIVKFCTEKDNHSFTSNNKKKISKNLMTS